MPIYKYNGDTYDIPAEKQLEFEKDFPDALISYMSGSDRYDIPASKREAFLKDFPDATELGWGGTIKEQAKQADPFQPEDTLSNMLGEIPSPMEQVGAEVAAEPPAPEKLRGFWANFAESSKGIWAGLKGYAGEQLNLFTGSSREEQAALNDIEELESRGINVLEYLQNQEDAKFQETYGMSKEQFLALDKKTRTDLVRQTVKKELEGQGPLLPEEARQKQREQINQEKVLAAFHKALEMAGGDLAKVKAILREQAEDKTAGDLLIEGASETMSKMKQPEGFAGWVGNLAPQMIPSAAALALNWITKGRAANLSKWIGYGSMGTLTLSTAGMSMVEARNAGATNLEVWTTGIADGLIEIVSEKIPFDRVTKRVFSSAKAKVANGLSDAISSPTGKKELEDLLKRANDKLGGKLFSGKNIEDWLLDTAYEAGGEFAAEALQTVTTMIYENPEDYPTIAEVLAAGWEGAKAGLFMGSILGGASKGLEHSMNKERRQQQGFVDVAEIQNKDGDVEVVEVVGYDPETQNVAVLHNGEFEQVGADKIGDTFRFSFDEFENARLKNLEDESIDEGTVNNGQIEGMRQTVSQDVEELRTLDPNLTDEGIEDLRAGRVIPEEGSPLESAVQRLIEDSERLSALENAKAQEREAKKGAARQQIESSVGQQFWMTHENNKDENGNVTLFEEVEEIVYADGKVGYVVGYDEAGNLTMVYTDGTRGFTSRQEVTDKMNSGEIVSDTPMGLDAYLDSKVELQSAASEQARMAKEFELNVQQMIAAHPKDSVINLGTEEEKVEVPIIAPPTKDGVIVQMPDGSTPLLRWEDVAHAEKKEIKPRTDTQNEQSIVDQYKVAYASPVAVEEQALIEEREKVVQENTPANPLPTKADGSVDQTALWNADPVRWAKWNDEQRKDGGANSLNYINNAIVKEQNALDEMLAAYEVESDFDVRDAMEKEMAQKKARLDQLVSLAQSYAAPVQTEAVPAAVNAAPAQEENVAPRVSQQMSEEEKAQMDAQYENILKQARTKSERVRLLQEYVNKISEGSMPAVVITKDNFKEAMRVARCSEALIARVEFFVKAGQNIGAFIASGHIFLMEDGLPSMEEARISYVHERQHAFNSSRPEFIQAVVNSVNGDRRILLGWLSTFMDDKSLETYKDDDAFSLADEVIARCMEIAYTTEEFSVNLQSRGISSEVISTINEIDNEQRFTQSYLNARRGARGASYDNVSGLSNMPEDGRNLGQVSGGVLEQQETRPSSVGDGGARARSTGEGAEVISEAQLNAPNSGEPLQITDANGEVIADTNGKGGVRFSIRTWREGGRDYLAAWLANDNTLTGEEKADILARMDEFYENAQKYTDTYVPFGAWSEAAVKYDNEGNPLMSVIKANGDYAMNLDFSLVCKKRRPLNKLLRTLINRNAFGTYSLKEREIAEINWILQEHGFEVACALCFVDAKRYRVTGVADVFAALYNKMVKALAPKGAAIAHFNYSNNPNVEVVENGIDTLSDDQLNWKAFDKYAKKFKETSVEGKVAKFLRENPSQRRLVDATDFIEAKGFEAVKEANPSLLSLYNSKKGTGGPKASFGDVQYLNDILKKDKAFNVEKAYSVGGVRIQSFSDFVPHMYFDYMQLFAELAAKKLPAHAYTKEVLFAKIFGLTGLKINLSLVPAVVEGGVAPGLDAEGNYAWADAVRDPEGSIIQQAQSFPYDEAMAIQSAPGYARNCGAIAVGISDEHIEKMLDDPNIPFIIPYHKSSLNAIVARMTNIDQYKDYTNVQNTRKGNGTKLDKGTKDFNFNEYLHGLGESGTPQMAAQAYLDWCRENNFKPKFSQFAYHPNYYKLLVDFNTVDVTTGEYTPQGAVTMSFPTEENAFGNVETLIQQGLQEDAELEEKMDTEIEGVADEVEARLAEIAKEPALSEKQQMKRMAELADERTAKIKAKSEGVIDLVEEAKKAQAKHEAEKGVQFRIANKNQAIFVSNAAKAVESIKMEKATPEQWLKMIEKNGGLKAGEDKWMGLSDWLKASDKKTLTKDEVLDFINENMIQIEEQHYEEGALTPEALWSEYQDTEEGIKAIREQLEADANENADRYLASKKDSLSEEEYQKKYKELVDEYIADDLMGLNRVEAEKKVFAEWRKGITPTRSIDDVRISYTTRGLYDKREIALTVPSILPWKITDEIHFGDAGNGRAIAWIRFGETYKYMGTVEAREKLQEFVNGLREKYGIEEEVAITQFGNANLPDELVDAISNEELYEFQELQAQSMAATDKTEKRILVIDEIQSKRHQEGRQKGYFNDELVKRHDRAEELGRNFRHYLIKKHKLDRWASYTDILNSGKLTESEQADFQAMWDEINASRPGSIPDAPFDRNWQELAMKRMLRYAAENGYDYVAWTKGDQQAQRYGLSRDVTKITTGAPTSNGERIVNVYYRDEYNDYKNFVVNTDGKITKGDYEGSSLAEILGKEMALQIMNATENTEFKGEGLKIGGEGMKGFYDKMLPSFMNKYGKKWGVKVEDIDLPNLGKSGYTMHSVPVTEEMKESVMEGQVMFRVRGADESAVDFHQAVVDDFKSKYKDIADIQVFPVNEETAERFDYTLDELDEIGGTYISEEDLIAIFAREHETDSNVIEEIIFHESVHKLYDFFDHLSTAGKWMWSVADQYKGFSGYKEHITENYTEGEYHEEMLSYMLGTAMACGGASKLYNGLPEDIQKYVDEIFNEIGYDRERESNERLLRLADESSVKEAKGSKHPENEGGIGSKKEKGSSDVRFRATITPEVRDEMDAIKASAIVMGNFMKAPNGKDTNLTEEQWALVRTKNFINWFGDWINDPENSSKAVDENGEPKVVYHGTGYEGYVFNSGFFASDEQFAADYGFAGNGFNSRVIPAFLNMRNPRIVDANYANYDNIDLGRRIVSSDELVDETREESTYDGLIIKNVDERSTDGATWTDDYIPFLPSQIKSAEENTGEFSVEDTDIRYRVVTDPAKIEELESGEKIKVYRAMQLIDGKLYPPMSAKVDGELRAPIELGQWEEAEERPDLADEKGYFKLDKGNKKSVPARYNPYFHTSPTPLNDQFASAQDRPNLVTVEVEVPASELTSGYKAEKAKDSVGEKEWKAGVIQGKLSGTRKVILSRWDKPVRIVPDSEVADVIVKMFEGKDIIMPSNVVTPSLRAELENRGVPFVETDNNGNPIGEFGPIYEQFRGKPKEAVKFLMKKKTGEAVGALNHKDIGDISIVYGNDKAGLKKIAVKHPEVLDILQDILDEATIVQQSENRIKLESDRYFAVISKDYLGKPRDPWLLTSFEKKNSVPDNTMDTDETSKGSKQNDTATLQDTVSEDKGSDNIDTANELEENISYRNGTPTEDVVAEGVSLSKKGLANLAGDIFAALDEDSRKKITDSLNGNLLGLQDAIMQIPVDLAIKENWSDEDKEMAEVVAEQMTKAVGKEMTRPFSASEALWTLYNTTHKETDLVSEASRALVRRNLGFDQQTLEMESQAREDVRFRTVSNASLNASTNMYNKGARNAWTRLKESFVDMNATVEELVKAMEKVSGKVTQGFENILLALNQQNSKGLAAMESYEQKFLVPMFDEIIDIMKRTGAKYETVVRYVILKHGLERNKKLAQRDAKAHYQEIYDDIIAKIKSMADAQKRTYLTNAQLQEADAKAELARLKNIDQSTLSDEDKQNLKKEIKKAAKAVAEAEEHLKKAKKIQSMSEQEALDELQKIFDKIENGSDSYYQELRKNDYSGLTSMFYSQLGVDRKDYETEEEYQEAIMAAKADKYSTLADVEAAAEAEVADFENLTSTDELWKRINAATKETLRQQYQANMISKDQYENLRDMFEFYVPLRGFADNTAEDMYTYYRRPNSTGYTKPILGAEGRKTEAESPFGWIAAMAGSAIASNVKNEAKLALYYFVSNRPDNGIATISRTWFVQTGVDADGKKIFMPAYPEFDESLSSEEAKQKLEDWQENMRKLRDQGQAYESGQRLNLGNTVVNIDDKNKPEHIVTVKVAGKDYTIIINGNPRAAQAINGDLNVETDSDYQSIFGPVLRWMSSVNTSYNPEFWATNMMRDMAFTFMSVNIKEDAAYRRKFAKNYTKAFKVIKMVYQNEKGTIGDSYLEDMYKEFVANGGVTGYTQIKDSETWENEIKKYMESNNSEEKLMGIAGKKMMNVLHYLHQFGESLEQVSRFAAFLTSREMGKSMNEAINDAKEITVNFNRKGSGKRITLEEARHLTNGKGQPLNKFQQWLVSGLSYISPLGRRFFMFFNASIQGLNATYKLWKKNKTRAIGWALGYAAVGLMNALIHALMDDDDDYLDIPQYERRNSLMLGGNGVYFKWALPQEARAFYALGDLAVETVMGRNPHQNAVAEATKVMTEILPVNPAEGWKAFIPSAVLPGVELLMNEDYKGDPIYNESKWLSKEEEEKTARWAKAYQGTGKLYIWTAQALNNITGGDEYDAGLINLQPEKIEHIVQSAFGGTIRTADKFLNTVMATIDPEEDVTVRQLPFLNRFLTVNDERFKNVHVNDVYDYYAAEAEHAITLGKKYTKARDGEAYNELLKSDEYKWARIYSKYKKPIKKYQEAIKAADTTRERMDLMKQQDELKRRMIKEISEL